jgi:predicted transcriptional regulator
MGNVPGRYTGLVLLKTTVSPDLAQRVSQAAKAIDQTTAAWLRLAIVEKLEWDAR